ncbi:Synaptotagmin-like protein 4 [Pseudolycoriella hygida]|uniref:Synaptotagmin-like protein 4 n=1 Tax=Pseudolycoriella hygida TaxID=35572 RepID=A0A9Q0MWY6_9DIPT|nr:Synaptotagmin-like protein 4 [Pseudolycoriella hygida]
MKTFSNALRHWFSTTPAKVILSVFSVEVLVNPVWNYTFVYDDVSLQELSERALELTIWDHDRLSTNEFLGGIRFSLGTGKHNGRNVDWMDSTGKELSLWQNMLSRPNFWVEGSVILRSSLEKLN